RTCLTDDSLRPLGEAMTRDLITHAKRIRNPIYEAFLYRDLAVSQAARERSALALPVSGHDAGLALWHPVNPADDGRSEESKVAPGWVAQAGHVRCLTGPTGNVLFFDYPLAGTFTFSVDATNAGWTEGHLSYGGLVFEAMAPPQPGQVFAVGARYERL